MSLSIGGNACTDLSDLGEGARACLGLIDGGLPWAGWAIARQGGGYSFDDETALVQGVQEGLHGTGLMLLPALGLTVAPARLMALEPQQLKALARGEAGGALKPAVRRLLTEAHLLTAADLGAGTAWLAEQGIAEAPVFQALDLCDRIALAGLAAGEQPEAALAKEASAFAVTEARAPAEFLDYRRLYLALAARSETAKPADRQSLARQCLDILLPWMFTVLDCPAIETPTTPEAVGAALNQWLDGGRLLGFARATAGARQICERTAFAPDTADVAVVIGDYLREASAVLTAGLSGVTLGQDGLTMSAAVQAQAGEARVDINALGHLSLDDFIANPEPA